MLFDGEVEECSDELLSRYKNQQRDLFSQIMKGLYDMYCQHFDFLSLIPPGAWYQCSLVVSPRSSFHRAISQDDPHPTPRPPAVHFIVRVHSSTGSTRYQHLVLCTNVVPATPNIYDQYQ